jgi:hypothetical protein
LGPSKASSIPFSKTKRPSRNHPSNQSTAYSTTARLTCTNCNKPNHTEATCFKKQGDLRNKSNNQTNPNEDADVILVAAPIDLGLAITQKLSDTNFIDDYMPYALLDSWYV